VQGYLLPKPVQKPHPVILNAGASPAGRDFSAREADFNFIIISTHEEAAALNREVRQKAAALGRECGVMTFGEVVCRDSEAEAQKDFRTILEKGDYEAATNILRIFGVESETAPGGFRGQQERLIAGWMGYPLVGTAEQIVDKLLGLSKLGMDGVLLSWLDYNQEIDQFNNEVLPLMKQAGLRQ
jgi:alkanesulfonate monooxygenase SsuD/methylene tetrahydromethanopterin reductase-like flavin-dependent oxidoreductase (luciferase family)